MDVRLVCLHTIANMHNMVMKKVMMLDPGFRVLLLLLTYDSGFSIQDSFEGSASKICVSAFWLLI